MKNFFLVVNKEKIYAYVVSVMTIVAVFFFSSWINSDFKNTQITSSNIIEKNEIKDSADTKIYINTSIINPENCDKENNTINNRVNETSSLKNKDRK